MSFTCVEFAVIIATVLVLVIWRLKWRQQYWKRKGLPFLKPTFPFGNIGNPFFRKFHIGILMQNMYKEFKKMGVKHGGLYSFSNPVYLPVDPDVVKNIMQKDFHHFQDRGFYHNERDDPLSAHLFAISGTKWRNLRTKLTPTFTSGKMKMMFETLVQCVENMHHAMQKYVGSKEGIDIKDVLARYTTDVIGSCAFGLECNSFINEEAEFRKYGKMIFDRRTRFQSFLYAFAFSRPKLARKFRIKLLDKEISAFFLKVVKDTVQYRVSNNAKRNDMLQILIDLKTDASGEDNRAHDGNALSMNEIAAQAFVFFIAGFETSSTTMTFCLYELAMNPDIQQRVRNEINSVLAKHNGQITYDAIMEMKYMGQVIDETLRKYPPLLFVTRCCVEDYHVPDSDVVIENGTRVFIPIYAFHHDSEYFPNPEKFDPERFSEENRSSVQPFTYLPFGEGPRLCIGMRFGLMQTKVGLTELIRNYIFTLNKRTATPFNIDIYSFILTAQEGIWLDIEKVHKG